MLIIDSHRCPKLVNIFLKLVQNAFSTGFSEGFLILGPSSDQLYLRMENSALHQQRALNEDKALPCFLPFLCYHVNPQKQEVGKPSVTHPSPKLWNDRSKSLILIRLCHWFGEHATPVLYRRNLVVFYHYIIWWHWNIHRTCEECEMHNLWKGPQDTNQFLLQHRQFAQQQSTPALMQSDSSPVFKTSGRKHLTISPKTYFQKFIAL